MYHMTFSRCWTTDWKPSATFASNSLPGPLWRQCTLQQFSRRISINCSTAELHRFWAKCSTCDLRASHVLISVLTQERWKRLCCSEPRSIELIVRCHDRVLWQEWVGRDRYHALHAKLSSLHGPAPTLNAAAENRLIVRGTTKLFTCTWNYPHFISQHQHNFCKSSGVPTRFCVTRKTGRSIALTKTISFVRHVNGAGHTSMNFGGGVATNGSVHIRRRSPWKVGTMQWLIEKNSLKTINKTVNKWSVKNRLLQVLPAMEQVKIEKDGMVS